MAQFASFLKRIRKFNVFDKEGFFFFLHIFMLIYRSLTLSLKSIGINDLIAFSFCLSTIFLESFYLIVTIIKRRKISKKFFEFLISFCLTSHISILFMTSEIKSSMCIISETFELFFSFRRVFTKVNFYLRFFPIFIFFFCLTYNFGFSKEFFLEIPPLFFSLMLFLEKKDIQLFLLKNNKEKKSSIILKDINSADTKIDFQAKKTSIINNVSNISDNYLMYAILNSSKKGLLLFDEQLQLQFVNNQTKEYMEATDLCKIEKIFKEMMVNIDGDQKFAYQRIS